MVSSFRTLAHDRCARKDESWKPNNDLRECTRKAPWARGELLRPRCFPSTKPFRSWPLGLCEGGTTSHFGSSFCRKRAPQNGEADFCVVFSFNQRKRARLFSSPHIHPSTSWKNLAQSPEPLANAEGYQRGTLYRQGIYASVVVT